MSVQILFVQGGGEGAHDEWDDVADIARTLEGWRRPGRAGIRLEH